MNIVLTRTILYKINMDSLPAIFLSHGAPDLPIRDGAVRDFLRSLHQQFPKPKAILVISAHWHSPPMVSAATHPRTIYDFSGFPSQLYELMISISPSIMAYIVADLPLRKQPMMKQLLSYFKP